MTAIILAVLSLASGIVVLAGILALTGHLTPVLHLLDRHRHPRPTLPRPTGTHGREIPGGPPDTHAGTGTLTMDGELTACGRPGPIATHPAYVTCTPCRTALAGR